MKTIFAIFALLLGGVTAFALDASDQKALATDQQALAAYTETPLPPGAFYSLSSRDCLTEPVPATFAELTARVDQAATQIAFASDEQRLQLRNKTIAELALWRLGGKFVVEGYAFARDNGYDYPYYVLYAKKLGIGEADELAMYVAIFSAAKERDLWLWTAKSDRFITLLNKQPDDKAIAILKTLNRVYSPKMAIDEEKYKPIVRAIRTMIETYQ